MFCIACEDCDKKSAAEWCAAAILVVRGSFKLVSVEYLDVAPDSQSERHQASYYVPNCCIEGLLLS
jgi:hypothetical protein